MKISKVVIDLLILILLVITMFWVMYMAGHTGNKKVVINCSISEISPDFTTEMREACRKAGIKKP